MQRDGIGHVSATAYIVLCVCVCGWVGGYCPHHVAGGMRALAPSKPINEKATQAKKIFTIILHPKVHHI